MVIQEVELLRDPPDEPPPGVTHELLWRVAIRLWREHQPKLACTCGTEQHVGIPTGVPRCGSCHNLSPCSGWRLALLGLSEALDNQSTTWLPHPEIGVWTRARQEPRLGEHDRGQELESISARRETHRP